VQVGKGEQIRQREAFHTALARAWARDDRRAARSERLMIAAFWTERGSDRVAPILHLTDFSAARRAR
jgi:hypothetical protein